MSRATLYSWFRGDTAPDIAAIANLARVLELSPNQLLGALQANQPAAALESRSALDLAQAELRIGDALPPQQVAWCAADDAIGPVAHRMYADNFSQMPVRDRGQWMGLLTSETIARWMAGRSRRGLEIDERAPVREVLSYAEDPDAYSLLSPATPVGEVLATFARSAGQGRPLAAILIVTEGQPEGEIEAIVTPYDVPVLTGAPRPV